MNHKGRNFRGRRHIFTLLVRFILFNYTMNINTIILVILMALSIILNNLKFEYYYVVDYVIIWYGICMLANYDLFI